MARPKVLTEMTDTTGKTQTSPLAHRIFLSVGWLVIFTIPTIVLIVIHQLTVDLPMDDDWAYASLIVKLRTYGLTFADLWAQHNEHRLFFPRLILIALHSIRGFWYIPDLINLNWVFAFISFLLILRLIWHIIPQTFWRMAAAIGSSLLMFTFAQDQTWLMGITNSWFLVNLFFVAAVCCLGIGLNRIHSMAGFWLALLCTVLATYSTGTAFPIWVALIPLVWVSQVPQRRVGMLVIWLISASITLGLYFFHYQKPPYHPDLLFGLYHPISFILYIAAYIGNPFSQGFSPVLSALLGYIGFVSFIYLAHALIKNQTISATKKQIPIALALFALGNAIITAITRVGFGWEVQAMASRYATISIYFWIGLICMGIIWLFTIKEFSLSALMQENYFRFIALTVCIPLLILSMVVSVQSYQQARLRQADQRSINLPILYRYKTADDTALTRLVPYDSNMIRAISASLENLQEGPFSPLSRTSYLKQRAAGIQAQEQALQQMTKSVLLADKITLTRGDPNTFAVVADTFKVRALDALGVYLTADTGQDICNSLFEIESTTTSYVMIYWDSGKGLSGREQSIIYEFTESVPGDPSKIKFYAKVPACVQRARIDLHYANGALLDDAVNVTLYSKP